VFGGTIVKKFKEEGGGGRLRVSGHVSRKWGDGTSDESGENGDAAWQGRKKVNHSKIRTGDRCGKSGVKIMYKEPGSPDVQRQGGARLIGGLGLVRQDPSQ